MSKEKHHNHMNCNCAQKRSTTITIPLDEYEELIRVSEAVDIAIFYLQHSDLYPDKKVTLGILGVVEEKDGDAK